MEQTEPAPPPLQQLQLQLSERRLGPLLWHPWKHTSILSLPLELQNRILSYLDCWSDIKSLRLTNRHFAHQLLPAAQLFDIHVQCTLAVHTLELSHHRLTWGNSDVHWAGFMEGLSLGGRKRGPRGLTTTTTTTSIGQVRSLSPVLPCYRCLRWLPTAAGLNLRLPGHERWTGSAFEAGMVTGTKGLGMERAMERVCLQCEIQSWARRR